MKPSPQAASAIIRVRNRMSNQTRLENPLTLNQAMILALHGKDPQYHVRVLTILLTHLSSKVGSPPEEAPQLMDAAGTVLFEYVLARCPSTPLLPRFVNCANRYGCRDWHQRAVEAYLVRKQSEAAELAKAA